MQTGLALVLALVVSIAAANAGQRLSPSDFDYLGAFAIDSTSDLGDRWNNYGQRGMSFDSSGDPGNSDVFPGSLWMTGHDYDRHVFELSIPTPVDGVYSFDQIPRPTVLTAPTQFSSNCNGGQDYFAGVEAHEGLLWGSCANRYNVTGKDLTTVMWHRNLTDLSGLQGPFHAGPVGGGKFHSNRQGMYMFSIPDDWAATHLGNRDLATGFSRNSHGGAMGPTILAFDPSNTSDGYDLLWYRHRYNPPVENCFADKSDCDFPEYTACDEWNSATWVRTPTSDAVLMAGKKYDGPSDYQAGGWVCDPGFGEIIFYDADDLAARAAGKIKPWKVIPYETWRPQELWRPGDPIGGLAYDASERILYLVERYAGPNGTAIIHAFRIGLETSVPEELPPELE